MKIEEKDVMGFGRPDLFLVGNELPQLHEGQYVVAKGRAWGSVRQYGDLAGQLEQPLAPASWFDREWECVWSDGSDAGRFSPGPRPTPAAKNSVCYPVDEHGNVLDGEEEE